MGTDSPGLTRILRPMLRRSKRNTRRSSAFVHQLCQSTMVLEVAQVVQAEARKKRRRHMMSFEKFVFGVSHIFPQIALNQYFIVGVRACTILGGSDLHT